MGSSTPKTTRVVREGTLDKTDFFSVMRDRKWYTLGEILVALKNRVPPELAAQHFMKGSTRRAIDRGEEEPESAASYAEKVARGKRAFIRKRLHDSVNHGFIKAERTGKGDDDLRYRWSQWSCWSCGDLQNGIDETPDKLCVDCQQFVSAPVDESSTEKLRRLMNDVLAELEQLKRERFSRVTDG